MPMTRVPAYSVDEIVSRHGCVACVPNSSPLPDVPAYATVAIAEMSDDMVSHGLWPAVSAIRPSWELVEIYVRPRHVVTMYEPLHLGHLDAEGAWVVVARKRHPSDEVRVVGIMLAKDESDAIPEVVSNLLKTLQRLYFYAPDAATREAVLASSHPGWARSISGPGDGIPYADGYRQVLLWHARQDAEAEGDLRPMWVMVVQGDEVYHDDLRSHIARAQAERATVMTCQVATFLLHESQRTGWNWSLPLERRLTHYIWDFGEHTGFLDFPWIHYEVGRHMNAHPQGIFPGAWASARPVRKHYPFRTPEQARARIEDRLKSGWQPHYRNYVNVFMGGEAAGRQVREYAGWFPEAERVTDEWVL